jgi:hypothetical protein
MGKFLAPPLWRVRWVRAEGKVEDRAEEYSVILTGDGQPYRLRHELPEGRAGRVLEEKEARAVAEGVLLKRFGRRALDLEPVSSTPAALPSRRDWYFVWKDPAATAGSAPLEGEGRYSVKLAGDEVSFYRQYVEVPERWQRSERQRRAFLGILRGVGGALSGLLALWVIWTSVLGAVRGAGFSMPIFWRVLGVSLVGQLVLAGNRLPERLASFSNSQPWSSQLFRLAMGEGLWALVAALGLAALWARASSGDLGDRDGVGKWVAWPIVGVGAAVSAWTHQAAPYWDVPTSVAHLLPELGALSSVFRLASLAALFVLLSQHLRSKYFALALGLTLGVWISPETLTGLLAASAFWGVAMVVLSEVAQRTGPGMWIGFFTVILAVGEIRDLRVLGNTPGGWTAGVGLVLILLWSWRIRLMGDFRSNHLPVTRQ